MFDFWGTGSGRHGFGHTLRSYDGSYPSYVVRQALFVVKWIDSLTLLWTDGERHLSCDYRIHDKPNDGNQNLSFQGLDRHRQGARIPAGIRVF